MKRNVKKRKQVKTFETLDLLKCKIWVNDSSYFSIAPFATKLLSSFEVTEQEDGKLIRKMYYHPLQKLLTTSVVLQ